MLCETLPYVVWGSAICCVRHCHTLCEALPYVVWGTAICCVRHCHMLCEALSYVLWGTAICCARHCPMLCEALPCVVWGTAICCVRHSVNRYSSAAIHVTLSFCLFKLKCVQFHFHEHCNIMVLLKLVVTFLFELHSDTVTDTWPEDVSPPISSLNLQVKSFCTSWRCVGEGGTAPLICNFDTKWKQVDSYTLTTWHQRHISRCPFKKWLGGSAPVCKFWEKKMFLIWVAERQYYVLNQYLLNRKKQRKTINNIWSNIQDIFTKMLVAIMVLSYK